jgi:hypothetical protein
MAVVLRQSRRFSAGSPVTRYWLAHCVGFSLEGDAHGTVERVLTDGDPFEPSTLEIRTRHQKLRRVPTEAVVEVVPSERLLVIGRRARARAAPSVRRREASARIRPVLRLAGRGLVALGALLLLAAVRLAALAQAAWRVGYPLALKAGKHGAAAGKRGGRESVRLVRSVPWQEYGRSARSATTRLSQASSSQLSRRRTTSSERRSEKSSGDGARTTSSN